MIYSSGESRVIKGYFLMEKNTSSRRGILQLAPVGFPGRLARGGEKCSKPGAPGR